MALAACLRGAAKTFYTSLLLAEFRKPYVILVEKIEQRFGSSRQQYWWLSLLEARRRQPSEFNAALADDLRQMSQKVYPKLDALAQEALSIDQLYKSISLEMKSLCMRKTARRLLML